MCFSVIFVAALYERRFGRFPAVIDRRYRAALIFPRCLAAKWPEEGADGEEDGLEDQVEQTAKSPKELGDFLLQKFRDPDEIADHKSIGFTSCKIRILQNFCFNSLLADCSS